MDDLRLTQDASTVAPLSKTTAQEHVNAPASIPSVSHEVSEESLKKSIASKLQRYRPLEKEANFTGPSYRT